MRFPGWRVLLSLLPGLALLLGWVLPGLAFQATSIELGTLQGEGWAARGVELQLTLLDDSHARVLLQARAARLPEPLGEFSDFQLECASAVIDAAQFDCQDGVLRLQAGEFGKQQLRTRLRYRFADAQLDFSLEGIRVLGGRLAAHGTIAAGGWRLDLEAAGLALQQLSSRLAATARALPSLEGTGSIALTAHLQGSGAALQQARFRLHLEAESFTNASGSLAGEELDAVLSGQARPISGGWRLDIDATARQGKLYVEPLYIEVPEQPIQASARLDLRTDRRQLQLHKLRYQHPGSMLLEADGIIDLGTGPPLRQLRVELREAQFAALYGTYLRPWLAGTLLGELEAAGRLHGELRWQDGGLARLKLDLEDLIARDREGRFELAGVTGPLRWSAGGSTEVSELRWQSGSLYRVELGTAALTVETAGRKISLLKPARIQVLDGELQLETFTLELGAAGVNRWQVDGILTPISMQKLSRALGWPEFSGRLSGVIPDVRYADGVLSVGGMLLVRVFDGVITLSGLRLERPLGSVPRLQLDARIKDIDLRSLTGTFDFGRIEGRLDGRVDDLQLESWRPVAFDATFATPPGDESRHRISQRAVDNISSIGGGVGGALSRSMLRFFEDFPYDRLGISCRLENGVCSMGGIDPADGGYYLVKGRLLPPRLNVIGYAERVDWDRLVAQIAAVTSQQNAGAE